LQQEQRNIAGLFMQNWEEDERFGECRADQDRKDALAVCARLGMPFYARNFAAEYWDQVFEHFVAEYRVGRTPNPDVLCNREIKFDVFMKIALSLGADFVATGHYCRKGISTSLNDQTGETKEIYHLLSGKDPNKDQSYFLCQLSQEQLSKTLFPIGELLKSEVRKIASEQNLITAEKRDSQGLCFIGKVRLPEFLQQKLAPKDGEIVEVPASFSEYKRVKTEFSSEEEKLKYFSTKRKYSKVDGKTIGTHHGAHYFTKGQRKGLAVGGTKEPLFVIDTDVEENIIYTGQGKGHPGLYRRGLFIKNEEIHWIREDLKLQEDEKMEVMARIRYRQPLEKATLFRTVSGLYVIFDAPQSAITEGQFVSWYNDCELLGSGVIS
jgi:tRNA-specific 2-thiouridylase